MFKDSWLISIPKYSIVFNSYLIPKRYQTNLLNYQHHHLYELSLETIDFKLFDQNNTFK